MPGHLPHIYSELARKAAGATSTESQRRQQSKARDWATLAAEVEAEEMRALP